MLEVQKDPQIDLLLLAQIWHNGTTNFKTLVSVFLDPPTTSALVYQYPNVFVSDDSHYVRKMALRKQLLKELSSDQGENPPNNSLNNVDKEQFTASIVSKQAVQLSEQDICIHNQTASLAHKALAYQDALSRFYPELPENFLETLQKSHHVCLAQITKTDPQACLTRIALNPAVIAACEIRNFILMHLEDPEQSWSLSDDEKLSIKSHTGVNVFLTQIVALVPEISKEFEKYPSLQWLSAVRELSYSTNASHNYESAQRIMDRMLGAFYANYLPDDAENRNANKEGDTTSDQGLQLWASLRDEVIKEWSLGLGAEENLTLLKLMQNAGHCPPISKERESYALMYLSLKAVSGISAMSSDDFIGISTIRLTPDKIDSCGAI